MPGYVERALYRFAHPAPERPEDSPYAWQRPDYGAKMQFAPPDDSAPKLDAAGIKRVQEVIGVFLFYARAIDSTMLPALGTLAALQTTATTTTMKAIVKFLDYAATHPDATVRFRKSNMILHIDSDASYLSEPKSRSRYAGYHYLSDRTTDASIAPPSNDAIHVPCAIMREVMSSAAEAELGGCFHNAKESCPIRTCLEELGHTQPATAIVTDNSTAVGIATETVKQKRSKAVDMRFYWLRDRVAQGQFLVCWHKGQKSRSDYFTKHHPAQHHRNVRPFYLYDQRNPNQNYYGCLDEDNFQDRAPHPAPAVLSLLHNTAEGVCATLRHFVSSTSSPMGEGVDSPGYPEARRPACRLTLAVITLPLTYLSSHGH